MDEPVRGEFWRTRLNMDPRDPAYDAGTPSAQMAETAGFTLVISRDSHNQESEFITVVPRTSSARFIWGGVRSPCGDGGCDKEALIDCAQPYTVANVQRASDGWESQLLRAVAPGRRAASVTVTNVEASLSTYFARWDKAGFLAHLQRKRRPFASPTFAQGDVVVAQWGAYGPVECVVVSNTSMNRHRPLPLVTVIPTRRTQLALGALDPITLSAEVDGVSQDCIALVESPYTLDTRFHIQDRLGRVRQDPSMLRIEDALLDHILLESEDHESYEP